MANFLHRLLLHLPPETAHHLGKWAIKHRFQAPGIYVQDDTHTDLFSTVLFNPLGLAAGFDKNGELVNDILHYGFSFIEVGSITYRGGPGNQKPRLFRVREEQSLINRMGFNGDPAIIVAERLHQTTNPYFAVNIAKTNDDTIIGDEAIKDIVETFKIVKNFGIYIVVNISCPNTKDGKTFEDPKSLESLLRELYTEGKGSPLLLKLSPSLQEYEIEAIIKVAEKPVLDEIPVRRIKDDQPDEIPTVDTQVDGYICGNSLPTSARPSLFQQYGKGGMTGPIIRSPTRDLIKRVAKYTEKPIIACGGISSGLDMLNIVKETPQVKAFQALTGFIYQGPEFAHLVNQDYRELKYRFREPDHVH